HPQRAAKPRTGPPNARCTAAGPRGLHGRRCGCTLLRHRPPARDPHDVHRGHRPDPFAHAHRADGLPLRGSVRRAVAGADAPVPGRSRDRTDAMSTRVFVTVGTDHHPFTRLIEWVDHWADTRTDLDLVVQHGTAPPARHGENHELLDTSDIVEQSATADLGISQVGPGRSVSIRARDHLIAELEAWLSASQHPALPSGALPSTTSTALAALSRSVLAAPRRRFSARRLLTVVRPALAADAAL